MNRKPHTISLIVLILIGMIGSFVGTPASALTKGDFRFEILGNDTARIVGYSGSGGTVVIPSEINGYPVTRIGDDVFDVRRDILHIEIPDTVTGIGDHAFSTCTNLQELRLPSSLKSIGDYAFCVCSSLQRVTVPASVTSLGDYAFSACSALEYVDLPDTLSRIGNGLFFCCSSLREVTLPASVTEIGDEACYACSSLSRISLPEKLLSIGKEAFAHCSALRAVDLPDTLTELGEYTFGDCIALQRLRLPRSVEKIGTRALGYLDVVDSMTSQVGYVPKDDFVLYGYADTAAEVYAAENALHFVPMGSSFLSGDADRDGRVTIFDATHIQRYLVGLTPEWEIDLDAALVSGSFEVSIMDVTIIQRYIAELGGLDGTLYEE